MPLALLAFAVLAVALVPTWLIWREAQLLLRPPEYTYPKPVAQLLERTPLRQHGMPFDDLTIRAIDGTTLRGWLTHAAVDPWRLVVVLVHGRAGDRTSMGFLTPVLTHLGASVATVDLRDNGISDGAGRGSGLGVREAEDVNAVVEHLAARGYHRIVVAGGSLGGSAAILAAADNPQIAGVIVDSALASMELYVADGLKGRLARLGITSGAVRAGIARIVVLSAALQRGISSAVPAEEAVARIAPRPLLIINGDQDASVSVEHAERLARRAGPMADLFIVPGAGHVSAHSIAPHEYRKRIKRLIDCPFSGNDSIGSSRNPSQ